jgi:hypothetical protein
MRRVMCCIVLLLAPAAASAQSTTGFFAGYVYSRPSFDNVHLSMGDSLNGWLGGVDVPVEGPFGLIARADGEYGGLFRQGLVVGAQGAEVRSQVYTVTAGPRLSMTIAGVTVFADGLVGAAHGRARNMGVDFLAVAEDTSFVGGIGGGVGLRLDRFVDLRADLQYRRTNMFDQTLNLVQVGVGIVVRPTRR